MIGSILLENRTASRKCLVDTASHQALFQWLLDAFLSDLKVHGSHLEKTSSSWKFVSGARLHVSTEVLGILPRAAFGESHRDAG